MRNKKIVILLIIIFTLLIGGASWLYGHLTNDVSPEVLATNAAARPSEATVPVQEETAPNSAQTNGNSTEETQQENAAAPDFTVSDLEGNEHKLSDYFGKPIVLNFWASWCGPCKSEMPAFQAAYEELGEEVQFLMVNMTDGYQETVESASDHIEKQGYTFPVFYDTSSSAAMTYGITFLPTTIFIDADGNMVTYAMSAISAEILQQGIDMIMPQE